MTSFRNAFIPPASCPIVGYTKKGAQERILWGWHGRQTKMLSEVPRQNRQDYMNLPPPPGKMQTPDLSPVLPGEGMTGVNSA